MWHLPSSLASSASGANSTVGATVPLNLGITEPSSTTAGSATAHQITGSNSETMQQSSVKDEFNNSSYTGADYSLQNLDSYYKTNSSASTAENKEFSASSQQENQQPPTTVKSDVDYSAPNSSSNEHILPTNHYDYPAYYSTV